jgi:hypothetical protein
MVLRSFHNNRKFNTAKGRKKITKSLKFRDATCQYKLSSTGSTRENLEKKQPAKNNRIKLNFSMPTSCLCFSMAVLFSAIPHDGIKVC